LLFFGDIFIKNLTRLALSLGALVVDQALSLAFILPLNQDFASLTGQQDVFIKTNTQNSSVTKMNVEIGVKMKVSSTPNK